MKKQSSFSSIVVLIVSLTAFCLNAHAQERRQVNVVVDAEPLSSKFKADGQFMFRVSIYNGLEEEIRFSTYALEPNGWNGETFALAFYDIKQRSGQQSRISWKRPNIDVPPIIAGVSSHRIKPKEKLYILIDAKKGYDEVK